MSEDRLILVFQPDNPCNTTITDEESGKVLYRVSTQHGKQTVTSVKNAHGETIASWEWRDVRSDILTLGNGTPVSASSWLRKSMVPFKDTVYLSGAGGKKFKWKGNGPGLQFELYEEGNKAQPIARFQKSRTLKDRTVTPPKESYKPATLTLSDSAQGERDMVVISFLLLEKGRRSTEASTLNRAEASALSAQPF